MPAQRFYEDQRFMAPDISSLNALLAGVVATIRTEAVTREAVATMEGVFQSLREEMTGLGIRADK